VVDGRASHVVRTNLWSQAAPNLRPQDAVADRLAGPQSRAEGAALSEKNSTATERARSGSSTSLTIAPPRHSMVFRMRLTAGRPQAPVHLSPDIMPALLSSACDDPLLTPDRIIRFRARNRALVRKAWGPIFRRSFQPTVESGVKGITSERNLEARNLLGQDLNLSLIPERDRNAVSRVCRI
jgi:hypothetical protein